MPGPTYVIQGVADGDVRNTAIRSPCGVKPQEGVKIEIRIAVKHAPFKIVHADGRLIIALKINSGMTMDIVDVIDSQEI